MPLSIFYFSLLLFFFKLPKLPTQFSETRCKKKVKFCRETKQPKLFSLSATGADWDSIALVISTYPKQFICNFKVVYRNITLIKPQWLGGWEGGKSICLAYSNSVADVKHQNNFALPMLITPHVFTVKILQSF